VATRLYTEAQTAAEGRKPSCTLRELATEWLSLNSHTASPAYWAAMEQFARLHFGDLLELDLKDISTEKVKAALNVYRKDHAEASGIQWRRYLRRLFGWAVESNRIQILPWNQKALGKMKYHQVPRPILPSAKWAAWLQAFDAATGPTDPRRQVIRLMLATGIREMEAVRARWEWFDWRRNTYTPGLTKGYEAKARALPQWVVALLEPHRRSEGWAFPDPKTGHPWSRGCCRRFIRAANAIVGTPGIMPHRLRATVVTELQRRVGIRDAQEAMAHKDAATTMGYTEGNPDAVRAAMEALAVEAGLN
jgi:integrase